MVMRINVLLVEDDHALREALADTLLLAGHGFRAVSSGRKPWSRSAPSLLAW